MNKSLNNTLDQLEKELEIAYDQILQFANQSSPMKQQEP